MSTQIHYLYWYHLSTHSNPYTEGYIGITSNLERRHKDHKYSSDITNVCYLKTHFTNAINKYGGIDNLKRSILHKGSYEEIQALERNYRPKLAIGWNIAIGGGTSGATSLFKGVTTRWSEEQKAQIGKAHIGKVITQQHIASMTEKMRASHSSCKQFTLYHQSNPRILYVFHSISEASRVLELPLSRLKSKNLRKSSVYGEDGWAVLFDKSFDRSTTPTAKEARKKALQGKPKPSIRGKNHWKNKHSQVSSNDAD